MRQIIHHCASHFRIIPFTGCRIGGVIIQSVVVTIHQSPRDSGIPDIQEIQEIQEIPDIPGVQEHLDISCIPGIQAIHSFK